MKGNGSARPPWSRAMSGDLTTPKTASPPPREPLIPRESLPPDLNDVRMSQLLAVRRIVLESRLRDGCDCYWLSWSRHLGALPLDLLDAWFESRGEFCALMDRTRVTRLVPPDGLGQTDPEAEKIVDKFFDVQSADLAPLEDEWWLVPDGNAWEWLRLTAEAQAAWLCGPDAWFPAYRDEPVAPYCVVRMTSRGSNRQYEIGPERPDGFPVRVTNHRGTEEWTWDGPYIERLALSCHPPEEQYWTDLGRMARTSDSPEG